MPKVIFLNQHKTVEFDPAALPYSRQGKPASVLDVALNFGVPLEHACGGVCACTTCHVWVRRGAENLSAPEDDELDRLDMAADLELCSRLGCQVVVEATSAWKFLPGIATMSAKRAVRSISRPQPRPARNRGVLDVNFCLLAKRW